MAENTHRPGDTDPPGDPSGVKTINEPTARIGAEVPQPSAHAALKPPEVPGFELRERIGAGGMGEVWSAEQREGVRRGVAIKLIRPGMDSKQLLARFEAEQQALALMDHSSIARVFGAGTTDDGRPFFAMELVKGTPIDAFCDRHRLGLRRRLELFLRVCEGVQHAHQKAIIHRDLKPSNILVVRQDDRPMPKIIDFGLAKAIGRQLVENTYFTRLGEMVGTPEYMSPEQADPRGEEVDTRTDVYSLGMVLYVLLVGALPFDRKVLREAGLIGLQKLITSEEPPRPSARVSQLGQASDSVAESRRTDLPALSKTLRGDLDWIVMKALEKTPDRRYPTIDALAADVERYLDNRAVEARPPTVLYRAGKFVRRHTLQVVAASAVVLALLAGAGFATVGLLRARTAEREALQQAETANRVTDFMVELFEVSDPGVSRGRTVTARELLDRGTEQVADLAEDPLVRGRLEHTLGRVYHNLGLYDESERVLEAARDSLRDSDGVGARTELTGVLHSLGVLYDNQARHTEAEGVFLEQLELAEKTAATDERDLARTLNSLAIVLLNQGRIDEAQAMMERALGVRIRVFGESSSEVAKTLSNLGNLSNRQGDLDRAEELFSQALSIERKILGDDHPDVAASLNNLGSVYQELDRLDEAELAMEGALAIWEKVLEPDHPDLGIALHNLGNLAQARGDTERALEFYRRTREIWSQAFGEDHIYLAINNHQEAGARMAAGDFAGAEPLLVRAIKIWDSADAAEAYGMVDTLQNFAMLLEETGRDHEAAQIRSRIDQLVGEDEN